MTTAPDPETVSWLRVGIASVTVLGLLALLSMTLKYISTKGINLPLKSSRTRSRRLQVVESLPLDPKRRLMIIRRDDREHLLLLGATSDIVVETNLSAIPQTPVLPNEP